MQQYELTLILKSELTEDQVDAIIDSLKLSVVNRQAWGKRLLSYPIDDYKEGLYIFLVVELPKNSIKDIDRSLQLHKDVIRHLLVRPEKEIKS